MNELNSFRMNMALRWIQLSDKKHWGGHASLIQKKALFPTNPTNKIK